MGMPLISMDQQTVFQLKQSETLTIPDTINSPSPADASSGVSPTTAFYAKRQVVGGMIYCVFNDAAGPSGLVFQKEVRAGDVIALSAVASNAITVTINGISVFVITGVTTHGGLLGFYA